MSKSVFNDILRKNYDSKGSSGKGYAMKIVYMYSLMAVVLLASSARAANGRLTFNINRTLDAFGRIDSFDLTGEYAKQFISYRQDGRIGSVSNSIASVQYRYSSDGRRCGYELKLSNGGKFTQSIARDSYRPKLLSAITNYVNGVVGNSFTYSFNALGRPTRRNSDTFSYDAKGALCAESVDGNKCMHEFDLAGNLLTDIWNSVTNRYTLNQMNRLVSRNSNGIESKFVYTANGELESFSPWTMGYDTKSQLQIACSNGIPVQACGYDSSGRRVRVEEPENTRFFVYDGWCPVLELIISANGTTNRIEYYWGCDISGGLQGVAGIGGLLFLRYNDEVFVPLYDAYGNITEYRSANGELVAQYCYDAFGRTIRKSGRMAEVFRHRYATRVFDAITGLYYYGYRYYAPELRRWLTPDPIGEKGGANLFLFCSNRPTCVMDELGLAPSVNWGVTDSKTGLFSEALTDFMNGGDSKVYYYTYPDPATQRLLSHPTIAKILSEFKSIRYNKSAGDYTLNRDTHFTGHFKDFVGDVATVFGASVQDGKFDFGVRVLGSFSVTATISVWNSRCKKRLNMSISNTFTVESMLRNPITRNPTITYPFLKPVTTHFRYDITERLNK